MDSILSLKSLKRHYKKDSRYVNDLYTLTCKDCESLKFLKWTNYLTLLDDSHESVEDTAELISSLFFRIDVEPVIAMEIFCEIWR